MIGDDFENDIRGAQQAGVAAVLIDRRGKYPNVESLRSLRELPAWVMSVI
jgi:FMN phosphatase YigB (HAD superfamily)